MTGFTDLAQYRVDMDGGIQRRLIEGIVPAPIIITAAARIPSTALARVLRELADHLDRKQ